MASGYDGSPRELLRRGLVDGALDLAGNCSCAAAHGRLGRLLPKVAPGRVVWRLFIVRLAGSAINQVTLIAVSTPTPRWISPC